MGKKKGKNTQQQEEERADNTVDLELSSGKENNSKAKKGRRKQFDEDGINDELMDIVNEQEGLKEPPPPQNGSSLVGGEATVKMESSDKGKKGKKKKSRKDNDWEDDVAGEIELMSLGDGGGQQPLEEEKVTMDVKKTVQGATVGATSIMEDENNDEGDEEEEESVGHVKTKAEKKAAKKQKQKDKKKVEPAVKETPTANKDPTIIADNVPDGGSLDEGNIVENDDNELIDDDNGDDDDDGKKKKKKKKKKEEEKKGGKSKKKPAGLLKMKEEIEALRAAQKKREEEEMEKQRKLEEEETMRLEKLRIEKEKKEKKKQKEKERKERLKKEGKLLTKSEKEKRAKQAIQMAAMIEKGLVVMPQLKTGGIEGERKPIRYGSRVRPKKNKTTEVPESGIETDVSSTVPSESISEDFTVSSETAEDGVKDNWDDESESDDDNTEEDDDNNDVVQTTTTTTTPDANMQPANDCASESGESVSEEESSSDSDHEDDEDITPYERARKRIIERRHCYASERTPDLLRSPVVCVLGHVDTGKTKILDKIRHTNVQDGEAGGITQQIGATFVPEDAIKEQTKCLKEFSKCELKVPGLLIIDTPGHESFSNLRTRGSSMCDIAILVVDIMHGLEPQTIESLQLLTKGKVPFVVALNKIDRLFDWRRNPTSGVKETLKRQKPNTKQQFDERVAETITQFAEKSLNAALFWEKVDFTEYIPLVPTSAISGDGMADLISQIVTFSEKNLVDKLMFSKEVEAIVLEVKVIAGLGTTIDVILRNGLMNEGDTMILTGSDGPFIAQSRALLMPQPLRELRVKNAYVNHKTVIASQGVKVCGKDLEKTLAGTPVLIAKKDDEIEVLKNEAASVMKGALSIIKLKEKGVFVQASTLGSLEALLEFLKTSKIPYAGINIGPVHRKDVMRASVMLERDKQWACILAFDVRVERDAQEMADSLGVKIFTADIIYHLFDNFIKYREELKKKWRDENEHIAIFPCKLRIIPNCVFNARNPIVMGVVIEAGILKPGTPICVPSKEFVNIGTVTSLEANHKQVNIAHKGEEVCIKIEALPGEAPKLFGRHFVLEDTLVSKISRDSINAVKSFFRDDLQKSDWQVMIELKKLFNIY